MNPAQTSANMLMRSRAAKSVSDEKSAADLELEQKLASIRAVGEDRDSEQTAQGDEADSALARE